MWSAVLVLGVALLTFLARPSMAEKITFAERPILNRIIEVFAELDQLLTEFSPELIFYGQYKRNQERAEKLRELFLLFSVTRDSGDFIHDPIPSNHLRLFHSAFNVNIEGTCDCNRRLRSRVSNAIAHSEGVAQETRFESIHSAAQVEIRMLNLLNESFSEINKLHCYLEVYLFAREEASSLNHLWYLLSKATFLLQDEFYSLFEVIPTFSKNVIRYERKCAKDHGRKGFLKKHSH